MALQLLLLNPPSLLHLILTTLILSVLHLKGPPQSVQPEVDPAAASGQPVPGAAPQVAHVVFLQSPHTYC